MPTPRSKRFNVPAGTTTVRLGRKVPKLGLQQFDSVSYVDAASGAIRTVADIEGKVLVLKLHGRGAVNYTNSRQYTAQCSGELAYGPYTNFKFHIERDITLSADGVTYPFFLRPVDNYYPPGGGRLDSRWMGFTNMTGTAMNCITERRLEALLAWVRTNGKFDPNRLYCTGFSMGAYGTMQLALRQPDVFAALYLDSPQWRYGYDVAAGAPLTFAYSDFVNSWISTTPANSPMVRDEDGGGRLFDRVDHLTYIANPANKVRWIGWGVNTDDTASRWEDHLEAYEILKATGRGFAFCWGVGGHVEGLLAQIIASYRFGMFVKGQAYPGFRNSTLDDDPYSDTVGGINLGFQFKVVEDSNTSCSFDITNTLGPCEVDVFPISEKFTASVPMQHAVITGANQWTRVTFTA